MFFFLSKTIAWGLYPLTVVSLALVAIWLWYHRRGARSGLAVVILSLYVCSAPITATPLVAWLEGPRPTEADLHPPYEVAVVLTGIVRLFLSTPGHLEFNSGVERILTGISLVKRGVAARLLIVGASGDLVRRDLIEADMLAGFAQELGVTAAQILIEGQSRNTYENAVNTAQLLRAGSYTRVLLITSAAHMRRAAAAFHKQGVVFDRYAVDFQSNSASKSWQWGDWLPSASMLATTTDMVHELLGLAMYRLQGYI